MWTVAFDDSQRLRAEVRASVTKEIRCSRKRHLQAVVLASAFGPWVAWRYMRNARDVWAQEWLDELDGPIEVFCHCDDPPRRVELGPSDVVL